MVIRISIQTSPLQSQAIIDLTDSLGSSNSYSQKAATQQERNYEDEIVFYKEDKQIHSEYHKRPFYFTSFVYDVELRSVVDLESSLSIMPLSTLEEVGIFLEHGVEQPTEKSNFGGNVSLIL